MLAQSPWNVTFSHSLAHSEFNYTVSLCMWRMCSTKYRKIPQMFSAVPGQEEKCTLSSSFLPLPPQAPCPVCESVCGMPLSFSVLDQGCAALKLNLIWLFHPFSSFFFPFPSSLCLTFCLSKGHRFVFVFVHTCARMHGCGLNVTVKVELEVFMAKAPIRPVKECIAQRQIETEKEGKRIMEQM